MRPVTEPGHAAGQIVTSVRFTSVIVRGEAGGPAVRASVVAVATDTGGVARGAASASPAVSRPAPASDMSMTVRRNRVTPPRVRARPTAGRSGLVPPETAEDAPTPEGPGDGRVSQAKVRRASVRAVPGPVIAPGGGGQLARNPHVTADNSRRQKHSTSSKPASRSALSSASSGKYRSSSDHAAKWLRACASVMP